MQSSTTVVWMRNKDDPSGSSRRRNLIGACLAHLAHDGYTDQLYALLPVWQGEFGLSYAGLALVRALYYAPMAGLQVPADKLTAKLSPRNALVLANAYSSCRLFRCGASIGIQGPRPRAHRCGNWIKRAASARILSRHKHLRKSLARAFGHLQFRG